MIFEFLDSRYDRLGKQLGSSNPLFYVYGGAWKTVGLHEPVAPVLEAATASLGYVGLTECVQALSGQSALENPDLAHDIMDYLNELVDRAKAKYGRLFALYATPAEGLVGKFQVKNRAKFGLIENVTDHDYLTNSYHVHVRDKVTPFEKIDFETPFFHKSNGGHIVYVEMASTLNSHAHEIITTHAVRRGLYFGANFVITSCMSCGFGGLLDDDLTCTRCGSDEIFQAVRICGYISPSKLHGKTRAADHKMTEIKQRFKHAK